MSEQSIIIDTPAGMEVFKLLQCIGRLRIEVNTGLAFRQSTLQAAKRYYGLTCSTKRKALELLEDLHAQVKAGDLDPMALRKV
jgi:hypothetical protein